MDITEPHFPLVENSLLSSSSIIATDDDCSRINISAEITGANAVKKDQQQQQIQMFSLPSFDRNSFHTVTKINRGVSMNEMANPLLPEPHTLQTTIFDSNPTAFQSVSNCSIGTLYRNFPLNNHNSISNDQQKKRTLITPHSMNKVADLARINPIKQDLHSLVSDFIFNSNLNN